MSYTTWQIPRHIIAASEAAFRRGAHEVFALWTGPLHFEGADCPIRRCVVPAQSPGVTRRGVYVHIHGDELSRIQVDNYHRGERSIIQLHTHPSADVRMSALDREWEVVKHDGALSIIVPNYCRQPLEGFRGANVYEREGQNWRLWDSTEVKSRLTLI